MKPGDLVTTVIPERNPGVQCYRVYDILRSQAAEHNRFIIQSHRNAMDSFDSRKLLDQKVIDKLYHHEVATIASPPTEDGNGTMISIITPRGIKGWINALNIKVLE